VHGFYQSFNCILSARIDFLKLLEYHESFTKPKKNFVEARVYLRSWEKQQDYFGFVFQGRKEEAFH